MNIQNAPKKTMNTKQTLTVVPWTREREPVVVSPSGGGGHGWEAKWTWGMRMERELEEEKDNYARIWFS